MPFQYILAELLARNPDALGAVFLDEAGETVDLACVDIRPSDVRLVAAHIRVYLRQAEKVLGQSALGEPRLLHIEREGLHVHAIALPDGYAVALLQRRPALIFRAQQSLARAADELERAVFAPPAGAH